jgi:transposase-like protein
MSGKRQNWEQLLAQRPKFLYSLGESGVLATTAQEEPLTNCPSCASHQTTEPPQKTALGFRTLRCSACHRRCNERTGAPFNHLPCPTDIVLLVVLWRYCQVNST